MNEPIPKRITKGQLLYLSSGSYSDYEVMAHARALRDFALKDMERDYNAYRQAGGGLDVLPWAIQEGFMEEIEATEIHLHRSYSWSRGESGPRLTHTIYGFT